MSNEGLVTFKVDDSGFGRLIKDYAAAALITVQQAFAEQAMLLANELVHRTPPFPGKKLKRMMEIKDQREQLASAGGIMGPFVPKAKFRDPEIESMGALKIGKRRVEKDIRRVIYGAKGATMPARKMPQVYKGQNPQPSLDWGILQRCEHKEAVLIFATKSGQVYGVDFERFNPNATIADMRKTHEAHRIKRGHVTTAGTGDRVVGRWRWVDALVTKEERVKAFIKHKQNYVGQAKGGWGTSFAELGGSLSPKGWIGKHAFGTGVPRAGECVKNLSGDNLFVKMINKSAWASGGDSDRIREGAMAGRARALAGNIRRQLEKLWGNKAGKLRKARGR